MKPSLIIFQPSHVTSDSAVEAFCEQFCESHYVYLIRPDSEFREDSPAGLRFLNNPFDRLPDFPEVETAVAVGDFELAKVLDEGYPECEIAVLDPKTNNGLPISETNCGETTVVRRDSRQMEPAEKRDLKRAI